MSRSAISLAGFQVSTHGRFWVSPEAMTTAAFTQKLTGLYVAYAPEFGVAAYGACQDEALNNLTEEIRRQGGAKTASEQRSNQ
jgi:hypothetical protein